MRRTKSYTLHHTYRLYKRNLKREGKRTPIDWKIYREICQEFNKLVMDKVLDGYTFKMPCGIGKLTIVKAKTPLDTAKVDFKATKLSGYTVKHLNDHSGGYYYMFKWARKRAKNTNRYKFRAAHSNTYRLSKLIRDKKADYLNKWL